MHVLGRSKGKRRQYHPLLICPIHSAITLRCYSASSNLPKGFWRVHETLAHAHINACQSLAEQEDKFCAARCTKDLAFGTQQQHVLPLPR